MLRYHCILALSSKYPSTQLVTTTEESTLLIAPASLCEHLTANNIYVKAFMLEAEAERYSQVVHVLQQCCSNG